MLGADRFWVVAPGVDGSSGMENKTVNHLSVFKNINGLVL